MNFNAKRLALLAGVGDPNDRHDIVQEQVQQLNESAEARQLNEDEEEVRKAVRRTIQKMISEGAITLQEDSIARELEHLRANIKADHDHIEALVHDMRDDRDEIERAEHHRAEMHEDEMEEGRGKDYLSKTHGSKSDPDLDYAKDEVTGGSARVMEQEGDDEDAARAAARKKIEAHPQMKAIKAALAQIKKDAPAIGSSQGRPDLSPEDRKRELMKLLRNAIEQGLKEADEPGAVEEGVIDESASEVDSQPEETLSEADATLTRLQMLAGVRILSEARDEDVEEAHCNEDEDPMEEAVVDDVKPDDLDAPPPNDSAREEEAHDEANLYELEDGRMVLKMGGRTYMMQEMEEELNELDEELREPEEGEMIDTASGQAVKLSTSE